MLKNLLSILFLFSASICSAQDYSRCKILLNGQPATTLAALGIETEHGELAEHRYFISDFSKSEINIIQNAGFTVETIIEDVQKWYVEQNNPQTQPTYTPIPENGNAACDAFATTNFGHYPLPQNMTTGSMGGYFTYDEMLAILDDMHTKFPQFISARKTISDTLLTHEGRPIWWVRISDNPEQDEQEPEGLFTALHHAREPLGLTQLIRFMWYIMEHYDEPSIKAIIDHTELYFVPCVNPDGYVYNQTTNPQGGGLWRKNRLVSGNDQFGVDLNRNYGYFWGFDNNGSSPNPGSDTYRGPSAFSEPETRLMRDFCLQHQFVNALNYHTFGNLMLYPYAYNDQVADPYLPILGNLMASKNNYTVGNTVTALGYKVNGSSDDWMYGERHTFSFTPEVGPQTFAFWPPASAIDSLGEGTQYSNISMAWSLLKLGISTDLSEQEITTTTHQVPVQLSNFSINTGTFTVKINNFDANVLSVSPASQSVTLVEGQQDTVWFSLEISSLVPANTNIRYAIDVDNTYFTLSDTSTRVFVSGSRVILFDDLLNNTQNWNGSWALTDEDFVTPPNSMTDSPFTNYANNTIESIQLAENISLPANALLPKVEFSAKWTIENNYDWVELDAITPVGELYQLCGKYSNLGTNNQTPNRPLWDGTQASWIVESVDLEQLKGKTFALAFVLYSDALDNADGFYFDNVKITYIDTTTAVREPILSDLEIQIYPNPAHANLSVYWDQTGLSGETCTFVISNTLGQTVLQYPVPNSIGASHEISTSTLEQGVYFCYLQTTKGKTPSKRLMIIR